MKIGGSDRLTVRSSPKGVALAGIRSHTAWLVRSDC